MIELAVAGAVVVLGAMASHAFHSWLRQRERERLSTKDKAELTARLDAYDSKLLELKNIATNNRRV